MKYILIATFALLSIETAHASGVVVSGGTSASAGTMSHGGTNVTTTVTKNGVTTTQHGTGNSGHAHVFVFAHN